MSSQQEQKSPNLEELPKLPQDLKDDVDSPKQLKHVETHEKNVLPTKEDVEQEKQHEQFKAGIEKFDTHKLRQVSTEEKTVLPTPEDIAKEKGPQLAASFDKSQLKHVEPNVKTSVEIIEDGQ
ncbi:thymosin beta-4 family domain-containing protein [Ditylenchus destructor]|uniref:Thymosin beta-4 family domain-containing protein n=1 Tax=Ditylenchus destructor TaxID=166010 RepID=A0AAD4MUS8_9BILA|nr:thymosin beta-4 family domain-containing protein [Ditylenchus destructor]